MLRSMWASFKDLLFVCDTRYAELLSGLLALGWGVTLLNTPVARGEQAQAMAEFAPLWWWGVTYVGLGCTQILGALFGWSTYRRWSGLFISPFWLFLMVLFVITASWTGVLAYGGFSAVCSWVYLRLANQSPLVRAIRHRLYREDPAHEPNER